MDEKRLPAVEPGRECKDAVRDTQDVLASEEISGANDTVNQRPDSQDASWAWLRHRPWRAIRRHVLSGAFGFSLNIGLTAFLHEVVHFSENVSFATTLCVAYVVNYILLRKYIFPETRGRISKQFAIFLISSAGFRLTEFVLFAIVTALGVYYLLAIFLIQGTLFAGKHLYFKWLFYVDADLLNISDSRGGRAANQTVLPHPGWQAAPVGRWNSCQENKLSGICSTESQMKTILVTGGAGFIGSCFVRQLIVDGAARVVNLDKLTYAGNLDSLQPVLDSPDHVFVQGHIGDAKLVGQLLDKHQPDAVVHFAAESHVDRSIDGPAEFVHTNVLGTFELLDAARRYWMELPQERKETWRFLHISTDEVYGSLGPEGRFVESTPYAPNSPYSASKASADHFARAYFQTYGLPVLITNCSNNYGPYQFPEKLIPLMILNALEGKPLPVYGDGQNVRDWIYVEDHCRGLRSVLEKGMPGEVYNLGGDCERTNLEIVQTICSLVDECRPGLAHAPCSSLVTFVKDRPGHDRRYAIDAGKARQELGWRPEHNFQTGLRQTVEWYLANSPWVERISSGVYRRQRLGLLNSPSES